MMKLFLLFVCFTFYAAVSGQEKLSASLIEDAIRHRKDVDKIIYLDSSINFFHSIKALAKSHILIGFKERKEVSLNLSKTELRYLDAQFRKQRRVAWKQNLFAHSTMISLDSLHVFDDTAKGPAYFEKTFGKKYFLFNQPVFLRNNSLAFFSLDEMIHPSAGYDFLCVYKREKGVWQQKMMVMLGAW